MKSKYTFNDALWFIHENKIFNQKPYSIKMIGNRNGDEHEYYIFHLPSGHDAEMKVENLYETKEQLIESL